LAKAAGSRSRIRASLAKALAISTGVAHQTADP
jgi:hypothetical protein